MSALPILVACFAPSLAWLGYFALRGSYSPEPLHRLLLVFGGGLLAGPLSLGLFELIERASFYGRLGSIDDVSDVTKLIYCLFAIGPIEELSKFLALWWFLNARHIDFDDPVDGIVYAAAAALGFATIENWYFMLAAEEPVWSRAITLPFNHVLFASFWGLGLGLARSGASHGRRRVVTGLLLAIAYHGLYDYMTLASSVSRLWVTPLVLFLWIWLSVAIRSIHRPAS